MTSDLTFMIRTLIKDFDFENAQFTLGALDLLDQVPDFQLVGPVEIGHNLLRTKFDGKYYNVIGEEMRIEDAPVFELIQVLEKLRDKQFVSPQTHPQSFFLSRKDTPDAD